MDGWTDVQLNGLLWFVNKIWCISFTRVESVEAQGLNMMQVIWLKLSLGIKTLIRAVATQISFWLQGAVVNPLNPSRLWVSMQLCSFYFLNFTILMKYSNISNYIMCNMSFKIRYAFISAMIVKCSPVLNAILHKKQVHLDKMNLKISKHCH